MGRSYILDHVDVGYMIDVIGHIIPEYVYNFLRNHRSIGCLP
jgi:hypothetical protein